MKLGVAVILFLFSLQTVYSQNKQIIGDTTYWHKANRELTQKIGLTDFETVEKEFSFRYREAGKIVEISKDGEDFKGTVSYFISHKKRANRGDWKFLFKTDTLSNKNAEETYRIVQESGILKLPSQEEIEDWLSGTHGETFLFEFADDSGYYIKHYWSPHSTVNIPEAQTVSELADTLRQSLNLSVRFSEFNDSLPKKGCYTLSSGAWVSCYSSNTLQLGYRGSAKLPVGFYISYNVPFIGKTKIHSGADIEYLFDKQDFHYLKIRVGKGQIFSQKDFAIYQFQSRKLNLNEVAESYQNHILYYGKEIIKNINFGGGPDFLFGDRERIGLHLTASNWFKFLNISLFGSATIFEDYTNYRFGLSNSIHLGSNSFIQWVMPQVYYEDYLGYKDLYFGVSFSF